MIYRHREEGGRSTLLVSKETWNGLQSGMWGWYFLVTTPAIRPGNQRGGSRGWRGPGRGVEWARSPDRLHRGGCV